MFRWEKTFLLSTDYIGWDRKRCKHCYSHLLYLVFNDVLKKVKATNYALEVAHVICILIKYLPRREALFDNLQTNTHGVKVRAGLFMQNLWGALDKLSGFTYSVARGTVMCDRH